MNNTPRHSTLTFILLGGILAVSTASIMIKFAQHEGAPSIVIAAFRLTLAALGLAPLALTRYRSELLRLTRSEWLLALLSGVFLALHFWLMDHIAAVYQRCQFGCIGIHHAVVGGAVLPTGAARARWDSHLYRAGVGPGGRDGGQPERCLQPALRFAHLSYGGGVLRRDGLPRGFPGTGGRLDGGRLLVGRAQAARQDRPDPVYLRRLWDGGHPADCDYASGSEKAHSDFRPSPTCGWCCWGWCHSCWDTPFLIGL